MSKIHELKTDPDVFQALVRGNKTYEIRKDDRGFSVGDKLLLRETAFTGVEMVCGMPLEYTGLTDTRKVTHILRGPRFGLEEGWVIMSVENPSITQLEADCAAHKAAEETQIALRQKADELAKELAASLERIVDAWMYDDTGIHDRYDYGVMLPIARYESVNQAIMESRLKGASLKRRDSLKQAEVLQDVISFIVSDMPENQETQQIVNGLTLRVETLSRRAEARE